MSLSVYDLANLLWSHIGRDASSPTTIADANDSEKAWIANAITSAQQIMRGEKPDLFKRRLGTVLQAPQTGTITLSSLLATDAVTLSSGTLARNAGVTARLEGALADNTLNKVGSSWYLQNDHDGSTGAVAAQVWHDCWLVGSGYESVCGKISVDGNPISVVNDAEDLWYFTNTRDYEDTSIPRRLTEGPVRLAYGETWTDPASGLSQFRLKFAPLPTAKVVVEADFLTAATAVTAAQLILTGGSAVQIAVPANLHESVLQPIALYEFSKSPWFRNAEARAQALRDYQTAIERLRGKRPLSSAGGRIVVEY